MKAKTIAKKLDQLSAQIAAANPYHESNPAYFDWVAPKEVAELSKKYHHYLELYSIARNREAAKV